MSDSAPQPASVRKAYAAEVKKWNKEHNPDRYCVPIKGTEFQKEIYRRMGYESGHPPTKRATTKRATTKRSTPAKKRTPRVKLSEEQRVANKLLAKEKRKEKARERYANMSAATKKARTDKAREVRQARAKIKKATAAQKKLGAQAALEAAAAAKVIQNLTKVKNRDAFEALAKRDKGAKTKMSQKAERDKRRRSGIHEPDLGVGPEPPSPRRQSFRSQAPMADPEYNALQAMINENVPYPSSEMSENEERTPGFPLRNSLGQFQVDPEKEANKKKKKKKKRKKRKGEPLTKGQSKKQRKK